MLQCKYHGWTYTLEGSLRGVPRFGKSDLFDKKDYGLVPLTLEEWHGLLFVRSDKCTLPLSAQLDGVFGGQTDLSSLKFYRKMEYTIRCNWKVYVDNYLEGYHVPLVHPSLNSILDYQAYRTSVREFSSLQQSPLSETDHSYGIQSGGQAFYFFIFPNFMLNVLPGRLQTNLVLPISHQETRVVFEYYYQDISDDVRDRIEEDIRCSDEIQKEDVMICEHVQRGLSSVGYDQGRFSPEMELGVYHFQSLLKKVLGKSVK
jgi:choline monooxygenase